jgi:hypothetical protein
MDLERVNLALLEYEMKLRKGLRKVKCDDPFIFVIGAPRSGTTLLTQVVAALTGAGYITNVAAQFHFCPVIGIELSYETFGKIRAPYQHIQFTSSHARTFDPGDINEYGLFWQWHLGLDNGVSFAPGMQIDNDGYRITQEALLAIRAIFRSSVVMKGTYPAYINGKIDEMLGGRVKWINIERHPLDCCVSIQKAMDKKFACFSMQALPDFNNSLGGIERIAAQVAYLRAFYRSIATYTITLEQLCHNPYQTLEKAGLSYINSVDAQFFKAVQLREYPEKERAVFRDVYHHWSEVFFKDKAAQLCP